MQDLMNLTYIGELVTPSFPKNHGSVCYRLYDIPQKVFFTEDSQVLGRKVIDKFYLGEIGLIIMRDEVLQMVFVLTQKGSLGWINFSNISIL